MGRTNPIALRLRGLLNWPSNVRHPVLAAYVQHIFQNHIVATPGIRASTTGIWINVTLFPNPALAAAAAAASHNPAPAAADDAPAPASAPSTATTTTDAATTAKTEDGGEAEAAELAALKDDSPAAAAAGAAPKTVRPARGARAAAAAAAALALGGGPARPPPPPRVTSQSIPPALHPKIAHPVLDFTSVRVRDALGRNEARIAEMSSGFGKNEYLGPLLRSTGAPVVENVPRRRNFGAESEPFEAVSPLLVAEARGGPWEALRIYRETPIHLQINVIMNPVLNAEVMAKYIAKELALNKPLPRIYKTILSRLG